MLVRGFLATAPARRPPVGNPSHAERLHRLARSTSESSHCHPARPARRYDRLHRIIAADDDPDIQGYYAKMLKNLGHQVVAVVGPARAGGANATALAPDLIITDIKSPDMEGIEASLKIYEEKPYPIVLVSGVHDPKTFDKAMAEQIVSYLLKPVTANKLREQIDLAMRHRGNSRRYAPRARSFAKASQSQDRRACQIDPHQQVWA